MNNLQSLQVLAVRAFSGTSFFPERRAESYITDFEAMLASDLLTVPDHYQDKYTEKFKNHVSGWLHSRSRVMSSMIVGPARFPVERMKKYNGWQENKYTEFMEWRKRLLASFARQEKKRSQGSELEQAIKKLADCKTNHEVMKTVNAIIRRHKGAESCIPECVAAGISEADVLELLNPRFTSRKGYPTYKLSYSKAEIKRLEDRVKELELKEVKKAEIEATGTMPDTIINGVIIRKDYTDNRLKVIFPAMPAENVRKALKGRGFNWSRYMGAWCRKLTNDAFYAAERICQTEVKPIEVEAPAVAVPAGWSEL